MPCKLKTLNINLKKLVVRFGGG